MNYIEDLKRDYRTSLFGTEHIFKTYEEIREEIIRYMGYKDFREFQRKLFISEFGSVSYDN